jgi:hypothetical protein
MRTHKKKKNKRQNARHITRFTLGRRGKASIGTANARHPGGIEYVFILSLTRT